MKLGGTVKDWVRMIVSNFHKIRLSGDDIMTSFFIFFFAKGQKSAQNENKNYVVPRL